MYKKYVPFVFNRSVFLYTPFQGNNILMLVIINNYCPGHVNISQSKLNQLQCTFIDIPKNIENRLIKRKGIALLSALLLWTLLLSKKLFYCWKLCWVLIVVFHTSSGFEWIIKSLGDKNRNIINEFFKQFW